MLLSTTQNATPQLDPVHLMLDASGPVLVVLWLLIAAAVVVWVIWIAKWLQLSRLLGAQARFEREASRVASGSDLLALADAHRSAPGAHVVRVLGSRLGDHALTHDFLSALSRRAVATEEQRAAALMPTLSSIAAASPFIGLFGTVWGIMQAFLRIGVEKSASLPVVAPAIGEALIATAIGLVAAIPALIAYNFVDRRIGDLTDSLSASADVWVAQLYASEMSERGRRGAHHGGV